MITFSTDENFIYLKNVPPSEKSVMDVYFNAVWSAPKKHWRLPLNRHVLTELWRTFPELRSNQSFNELGKLTAEEVRQLLDNRKRFPYTIPNNPLRPYQLEDVRILEKLPSAGIFNEPRTGKTPTAISLMKRIGGKRNLVVCPASLTLNWEKEIREWWPEAKIRVVDDKPSKRQIVWTEHNPPYFNYVFVVSKDTLKSDIETVQRLSFDTCFIDEAHFLRNYQTAQSKAIFKIKAERKYTMTGTPTVNHPSDIWGILHFLDPKAYPSYWQFTARYFETFQSQYSAGLEAGNPKKHREAELKEIVGLVSVSRKRSEVMAWLPKKQYSKLPVKMEGKQLKLYNEMKNFFTATDDPVAVDTPNVITQLMRMRQLCLDPRLLGFDEPGAKTKTLLDYLENRREPIVIMTMFTSYLKMIAPEIKNRKVGMIHGEMSAAQKQQSVLDFQMGRIDVLLCNIVAAGVGLTLDRSNTVLFLDRAWTPAENDQAEDRVCPTSQERNHAHLIVDLECVNSVDTRINAVLKSKRTLTDYINEGGRAAIKSLLGE
jgi:SNF2 family DNA or RNA helicase